MNKLQTDSVDLVISRLRRALSKTAESKRKIVWIASYKIIVFLLAARGFLLGEKPARWNLANQLRNRGETENVNAKLH